jgi:hypothetical protein
MRMGGDAGDLWHDEEHAYAVVTARGGRGLERPERSRSGLSHVEAMTLAEELQREGEVVTVMHVIGSKSYEVDRYPAR